MRCGRSSVNCAGVFFARPSLPPCRWVGLPTRRTTRTHSGRPLRGVCVRVCGGVSVGRGRTLLSGWRATARRVRRGEEKTGARRGSKTHLRLGGGGQATGPAGQGSSGPAEHCEWACAEERETAAVFLFDAREAEAISLCRHTAFFSRPRHKRDGHAQSRTPRTLWPCTNRTRSAQQQRSRPCPCPAAPSQPRLHAPWPAFRPQHNTNTAACVAV